MNIGKRFVLNKKEDYEGIFHNTKDYTKINNYILKNKDKFTYNIKKNISILHNKFPKIDEEIKYNCVNYQAGVDSGDLQDIFTRAGNCICRYTNNAKIFYLDLVDGQIQKKGVGEPTAKNDTVEYSNWVVHSRANEFIGRAVPPILMKYLAEHIYKNFLN